MVLPGKDVGTPRAYIDTPVVTLKITKWKPVCASGKPKDPSKTPLRLKCIDCSGIRVHGMGKPGKAKYGFEGVSFYWCMVCMKELRESERHSDSKRIACAIEQGWNEGAEALKEERAKEV